MNNVAKLIGILVVAVAVAGCGKSGSKDVPPAKIDKPEKLVMALYEAVKAGSVEKIWALYSKNAREGFSKFMTELIEGMPPAKVKTEFGVSKAKVLKLKGLALMKLMASTPQAKKGLEHDKNIPPPKNIKVEISGDSGVVRFEENKGERRFEIVKENGFWLLKHGMFAGASSADDISVSGSPLKHSPPPEPKMKVVDPQPKTADPAPKKDPPAPTKDTPEPKK